MTTRETLIKEGSDTMNARLLIIDPQNDFCDIPGAALPVTGADADMKRLAAFVDAAGDKLGDIVVTLDSHPVVAIERPTFWRKGDGSDVNPFTLISRDDVAAGTYVPRNEALLPQVLTYLEKLEAGGKYKLMVWTVHCVLGTWGHNIHATVATSLAAWETQTQREAAKVLKGRNPLTEAYSAVRAEVPREDDESTQTNRSLIERVRSGKGLVFIAGEASSHCVPATLLDILPELTAEERARIVVLRDCMSPVGGFEAAQDKFFATCADNGVRVTTSTEALALLA
jgi:nicotinamidase/pyrazinamidase